MELYSQARLLQKKYSLGSRVYARESYRQINSRYYSPSWGCCKTSAAGRNHSERTFYDMADQACEELNSTDGVSKKQQLSPKERRRFKNWLIALPAAEHVLMNSSVEIRQVSNKFFAEVDANESSTKLYAWLQSGEFTIAAYNGARKSFFAVSHHTASLWLIQHSFACYLSQYFARSSLK